MNMQQRPRRQRQGGFTLVEIAMALGVIVFALVAIIGVLPAGLNVQKDNRMDTVINQDGPYMLELIRNGVQGQGVDYLQGLDYLTNYVETIYITNWDNSGNMKYIVYTNKPNPPAPMQLLDSGNRIIQLLSSNKYDSITGTNYIYAQVRALTGTAIEQGQGGSDIGLRYLLRSEIVAMDYVNTYTNDYANYGLAPEERADWTNAASKLKMNLYQLRLSLAPLYPGGGIGREQVFRTLVSASIANGFFNRNTYSK